jgi:amino acid transporter
VPVNVTSGILATLFLLAVVIVNHLYSGGNLASLFSVVLSIAISTTTFSYLFIFPALIVLRYKFPNAARPYRVPGGMAGVWIVGGITWLYALAATVFSLWPGLFSDAVLGQSGGVDRAPFEITVLATMAIVIAVGVVFYFIGKGHAVYEVLPGEAAPVTPEMVGAPRS